MTTAYELAKTEIGTVEWRDGSNPKVVAYFRDAGAPHVKDDETAWCAAFVGAMLARSGGEGTGKLTARSYLDWGQPVTLTDAQEGDIAVFKRGNSTWQGHVAFFVKENGANITVLGGNQSDQVKLSGYPKSSLLGIRRRGEFQDAIDYLASHPKKDVIVAPPPTPPRARPGFWAWLSDLLTGAKP